MEGYYSATPAALTKVLGPPMFTIPTSSVDYGENMQQISPPSTAPSPSSDRAIHLHYLNECLALANRSPRKPTNFRAGAILLRRHRLAPLPALMKESDERYDDAILSTGYTLELPGNTHAEECCLAKYASHYRVQEHQIGDILHRERSEADGNEKLVMYVTMEPLGKRMLGNTHCAWRIAQTRADGQRGIDKIFFGVKEPETFVGESEGCKILSRAGVEWELVGGMETEILKVATLGHEPANTQSTDGGTNVDDISEE